MPAPPKTDESELAAALEARDGQPGDVPSASIDELVATEDVDGLIRLGAAYRTGDGPVERDLFKAVECFEAASRFGSAEAEYLVALAFLHGLGVGKDLGEGAKRLRSAAQRGSLRAKVYVANLYEMGVHYAADREKADVWYRNVARAAAIEADPSSEEYARAMAELGCVRHCLAFVSDERLPTKDRAFFLKRAKAMGYGHRLAAAKRKGESAEEGPAEDVELEGAAEEGREPPAPAEEGPPTLEEEDPPAPAEEETEEDAPAQGRDVLGAQWTLGAGLAAWLVAAAFAVASFFTAWLATEGSIALAAQGRALPYVGEVHDAVFCAVVLVFGALPAVAVYRARVVAVATLFGLAGGAAGWYLHASRPLLWSEGAQAGASGLAASLLVLLVLGAVGGTCLRDRRGPRGGS